MAQLVRTESGTVTSPFLASGLHRHNLEHLEPGHRNHWRRVGAALRELVQELVAAHLGHRQALAVRVLDSLGCAIGALDGPLIAALRAHDDEVGGRPLATRIGGGRTAPDHAAFYNSAPVCVVTYKS